MTIMEMLEQSAILTILGMTVVFGFLWIMIICVTVTGKLIHGTKPDNDVAGSENGATGMNKEVPPGVIAAISASLTEYQDEDNGL